MKFQLCYVILIILLLSVFFTSCATTPYLTDNDALEELNGMIRYEYNISTYDHQAEQQKELQQKKEFCEKYGHEPHAGGTYYALHQHWQTCKDCAEFFAYTPHTAKRTEAFDMVITDGTCYVRTRDLCECGMYYYFHYEPVDLTGVPVTSSPAGMTLEEADVYFDEMEAEGLGEWVEYAKEATE